MSVPRPEPEILAEQRKVDGELAELGAAAGTFDRARKRLEDAEAAAVAAMADTATPWSPPEWSRCAAWARPRDCRDDCRRALEVLAEIEVQGVDRDTVIPRTLAEAAPDLGKIGPRAGARADDLRQRREELFAELALRRKGPGKPKPYRLLSGTLGREEAGVSRRYKAGATLELNDWERLSLGEHRVEPVTPAT